MSGVIAASRSQARAILAGGVAAGYCERGDGRPASPTSRRRRPRVAGRRPARALRGRAPDARPSSASASTRRTRRRRSAALDALRADLPDPRPLPVPASPRELARRRIYQDAGAVVIFNVGCVGGLGGDAAQRVVLAGVGDARVRAAAAARRLAAARARRPEPVRAAPQRRDRRRLRAVSDRASCSRSRGGGAGGGVAAARALRGRARVARREQVLADRPGQRGRPRVAARDPRADRASAAPTTRSSAEEEGADESRLERAALGRRPARRHRQLPLRDRALVGQRGGLRRARRARRRRAQPDGGGDLHGDCAASRRRTTARPLRSRADDAPALAQSLVATGFAYGAATARRAGRGRRRGCCRWSVTSAARVRGARSLRRRARALRRLLRARPERVGRHRGRADLRLRGPRRAAIAGGILVAPPALVDALAGDRAARRSVHAPPVRGSAATPALGRHMRRRACRVLCRAPMAMKSSLEIAQEATLVPIEEIAERAGLRARRGRALRALQGEDHARRRSIGSPARPTAS